jgi:hypothetical protein
MVAAHGCRTPAESPVRPRILLSARSASLVGMTKNHLFRQWKRPLAWANICAGGNGYFSGEGNAPGNHGRKATIKTGGGSDPCAGAAAVSFLPGDPGFAARISESAFFRTGYRGGARRSWFHGWAFPYLAGSDLRRYYQITPQELEIPAKYLGKRSKAEIEATSPVLSRCQPVEVRGVCRST